MPEMKNMLRMSGMSGETSSVIPFWNHKFKLIYLNDDGNVRNVDNVRNVKMAITQPILNLGAQNFA